MGQKKPNKDDDSKAEKAGKRTKADKEKAGKDKPAKPSKSDARKAEKKAKADKSDAAKPARPQLTHEDALALAEALVEMVNDGAEHPVAFFVSGDDALGRELIQLQGGEAEDLEGVVPVVLDASQVRRFAMLTVVDELLWRRGHEAS